MDLKIKGCTQYVKEGANSRSYRLAYAYVGRADAYTEKGEYERAIADATKAIEIGHLPVAFNQRAWAYFKAGNAGQGLSDANKAIAKSPDNAEFLDTRAHIFEATGRPKEAIADYRQALKIDPDNPEIQGDQEALRRLGTGQ